MKIDGSFVREALVVDGSAALIRSMIQLADLFGMAVVAECVETEEQAELLRSLGCTAAQGFLYSPALPGADLAARFFMDKVA
ncbi:PAS/PAC sensor(s)-containing diguanylate cyclase/phosphodiesterase [Paramagnetospirillum caucaseum]|uniref:PAS/PAC sensor(S)-containing diguanylate cyclase/phosphodiesterase n=1 Tax=Paramagnetospirillum caucaseum TaxID=1244869 RepID=M3A8H2_9PROT|nr:EAL domain-containing protein [Paramagnetospirillum caucaseum]EME68824.1 PAS/PAC sensor(s)-containing diguanylate cyclase/phosphodiesterase [Paramagnetospirillum caucaseum]